MHGIHPSYLCLPQLPNEAELLDAVVQKVGPFADKEKLCYHIRISAGKVHWAGEQLPLMIKHTV